MDILDYFRYDVAATASVGQGPNCLEAISYIEITLNHPRTAKFKRMGQEQQKQYYLKWIDDSLSSKMNRIMNQEINFELCRDGTVHCHMLLQYKHLDDQWSRPGLVSDIVSAFLRWLPPRHGIATFDMYKNYYYQYCRYVCPSIACQLTYDPDRVITWETYIRKSQ